MHVYDELSILAFASGLYSFRGGLWRIAFRPSQQGRQAIISSGLVWNTVLLGAWSRLRPTLESSASGKNGDNVRARPIHVLQSPHTLLRLYYVPPHLRITRSACLEVGSAPLYPDKQRSWTGERTSSFGIPYIITPLASIMSTIGFLSIANRLTPWVEVV